MVDIFDMHAYQLAGNGVSVNVAGRQRWLRPISRQKPSGDLSDYRAAIYREGFFGARLDSGLRRKHWWPINARQMDDGIFYGFGFPMHPQAEKPIRTTMAACSPFLKRTVYPKTLWCDG
jgi:hypothetical protein